MIDDLNIPRIRDGGIEFRLFEKYQRRQYEVDAAIGRLFLLGVSTRKLKNFTREFLGAEISATTISKTTETMEKEMEIFQQAEISDEAEFLFLHGWYTRYGKSGWKRSPSLQHWLSIKTAGSSWLGSR